MSLDLQRSFTYLKDDADWGLKVLIGGVFTLIVSSAGMLTELAKEPKFAILVVPIMLVMLLLGLLASFFVSGYYVKAVKARGQDGDNKLPVWQNFLEIFVLGFRYNVGYLLFLIPYALPCIILFLIGFAAAITAPKDAFGIIILSFLPAIGVGLVMMLIVGCITPLMVLNFVEDDKILSFYNYKKAFGRVKGNFKNYLMFLLFMFAIATALGIASFVIGLVPLLGSLVVPFVSFFITLVIADLLAQFGRTKQVV